MDLSVVILSFNTQKLLEDCLNSIFQNTEGIEFEIIVVDNGSIDGSVEMVKELIKPQTPNLKLIENKINLGFAKGNNQGLLQAQGKYILLLNSDTIVKNGALKKMVEFMDEHLQAGVVGPKLLNPEGTPQASAGSFPSLPVIGVMLFKEHFGGSQLVRTSYQTTKEVDWVMGAAMMVKREIFPKTGLFDENIFMYYDEVEWCYRIKKAGFKIYFYPEAEIVHLWQRSSQTGRKGPILANYQGLVYFYKKHKSTLDLFLLRILLKLKAGVALIIGHLTNNSYLKETYAEAFKLA
ncbi:MAG: glycosyltransferase family 2 protein [Patescibacteria group bacterium]